MSEPTLYVLALEGFCYRLLKEFAAYDSEMPPLMADKITDSFVRTDVVVTPSVRKYIISRLEVVDTTKLSRINGNSVRRCLLFLYNIPQ